MYKALAIKAESFQYEDYNTFAIQYPGVQLILAASGAVSPTEGFLTHLRNQTASQNGVFKGTALLIIHNTSLDSIIGGAEGLTKEGNPLHIKSFRKALLNSIDSLSADPSEKQGLRQVLEE